MSRHGVSGASRLSRAVLERVQSRDPDALAALFETHFDRVYGLAYRLLGEREAAEDVTQGVFLRVYRAAHRLDPDRDPGPWLLAITSNVCRDLWRSGAHRLARRSTSIEDVTREDDGLLADAHDPQREMLSKEHERLVQRALMRLPESLRATVLLHDYQGLGHEETAAILGVSHAAVRKRYSRALESLGEMLEELQE